MSAATAQYLESGSSDAAYYTYTTSSGVAATTDGTSGYTNAGSTDIDSWETDTLGTTTFSSWVIVVDDTTGVTGIYYK